MSKKQVCLWVLLSIVIISMLTGIAAIVWPNNKWIDERVLITIFMMGAYALGGLVLTAISRSFNLTAKLCAGFLVLSMSIFTILIWFDNSMDWEMTNRLANYGGAMIVIAITLAHRLLIVPLNMHTFPGQIGKRASLIGAGITAFILCVILLEILNHNHTELIAKLGGVSGIISVGSTIGTCAIFIFGPKPGDDEPGILSASIPVKFECPRCLTHLEVDSNKYTRCTGCKLKVRVELEEPRCSCGYLLYQLESDQCPECGKPISLQEQWGPGVTSAEDPDPIDESHEESIID